MEITIDRTATVGSDGIPSRFTVRAPAGDMTVTLDVIREDEGVRPVRVARVEVAGDDVTGEALRRVSVWSLVRAAVAQMVAGEGVESVDFRIGAPVRDMYHVRLTRSGRLPADIRGEWPHGDLDVFLRAVVAVYRAAMTRGDAPTVAVASAADVSRPTAVRMLRAARDRGLLGRDEVGWAGGAPAKKEGD